MNKGFTLVELLVSIAIIGLLSSIIVVGISNTRERSRDARRMSDLKEIGNALGLYYTGANAYPTYTGNITGTDLLSTSLKNSGAMSEIPLDPVPSQFYTYTSVDGSTYILGFCLETDTIGGYSKGCGNQISQ